MTRMGKVALDRLGAVRPSSTAASTRSRDCDPDAALHLPLPPGQHHLVGRARATAATPCSARSAWRSASPATWRENEGWLAEHMLILEAESPAGREAVRGRRLPLGLRQDQLRHDDPAPGLPGLEDPHRGRRHRLDAGGRGRAALGRQPRERLLRRGPGHQPQDQPQRHGDRAPQDSFFTNVGRTAAGDIWWEGMDSEAPAELHRLEGRRPGRSGSTEKSGPPQQPVHRAGAQQPGPLAVDGRPPGRAHLRHPLRRPPRHHRPAGARGVQLDPRRVHGRHHGLGDHRRRRRPEGGRAAATRWPCCPSCGYDAGSYLAHWLDMQQRIPNPPKHLHGELVPQGRRGQVPLAGVRRQHARPEVDPRPLRRTRSARRRRCSASPRGEGDLASTGIDASKEAIAAATRIDLGEWEEELDSQAEWFEQARADAARPLALQRELLLASSADRAARKVAAATSSSPGRVHARPRLPARPPLAGRRRGQPRRAARPALAGVGAARSGRGAPRPSPPLDLQAGGTWIGVSAAGLFAGVTNHYVRLDGTSRPPRRSPRRARAAGAGGSASAARAAAALAAARRRPLEPVPPARRRRARRLPLVVRRRGQGSSSWGRACTSPPSATREGRGARGRVAARPLARRPHAAAAARAAWSTTAPPAGPGGPAICIHGDPLYGTRSSAILRLAPALAPASSTWPTGRPCTAPLEDSDRSDLLVRRRSVTGSGSRLTPAPGRDILSAAWDSSTASQLPPPPARRPRPST